VRVVLLVYRASIVGGRERARDDAAELAWRPAGRTPAGLAFRSHRQALADYRRSLVR
jgi:hypothetical protein